jgi:trehalose 6-phosphate phosphatase
VTGPDGIEPALLAARQVLQDSPSGLFTDVDGTISPIVVHPLDARVPHAARVALRRLRDQIDTVGVISGRAAADARRMVRVGRINYVGNHGLERLHGRRGVVDPAIQPFVASMQQCVTALNDLLQDRDGIIVENKLATATLHYRTANDPVEARRTIIETIDACIMCRGLRVEEGRMVINVLPPVAINKGAAVMRIAEERQLRGVVYLGDDSTDLHAFFALHELRHRGLQTAAIAVGSAESPVALLTQADAVVSGVESAVALLDQLSRE